jgi:hypothetical protein
MEWSGGIKAVNHIEISEIALPIAKILMPM